MQNVHPARPSRGPLRALLAAATVAGLFAGGAALFAEECAKFRPSPEHAILTACEGAYDLTFSDGSKGTSSCRAGLGGQWLQEQVRADFCGQGYEGAGATSYDPVRKRYVNVWIDSASPSPLVSEGAYDPATKTLTLAGDMTTPEGKAVRATLVIVQKSADTRTFTMKVPGADGTPVELFSITYQRRKS